MSDTVWKWARRNRDEILDRIAELHQPITYSPGGGHIVGPGGKRTSIAFPTAVRCSCGYPPEAGTCPTRAALEGEQT